MGDFEGKLFISKGVFERRPSTGSEATKFAFLSGFIMIETKMETICSKIWAKPPSKNEKRPLPG